MTEEIIETIYGMGYRLKPAPKRQNIEAHSTAQLQIAKDQSSAIATLWKRFQRVCEERLVILESHLTLTAPDVVLLDLSFPESEEDGLAFLQELTMRSPNLPIIVFTGRDSLTDRLEVSRLGARQFLKRSPILSVRLTQSLPVLLIR